MNPHKSANQKKSAIRNGLLCWLLLIFASLVYGRSMELADNSQNAAGAFLGLLNGFLENPLLFFTLFPRTKGGWMYGGYGMICGMIAPLISYNNYLQKKDLRPDVEHGSAKWNDDLSGFKKKYTDKILYGPESKNMIMAEGIFVSMDTRRTRRNNNVLMFGGSGTGKSTTEIIPNLMQANCSFVVTDPSGEILEMMGSFLESEGYEIRVFNLNDMTHSDRYNPLRYIRNPEGVLILIDAIIQNTNPQGKGSNDPFWEKSETALLQALCYYVLAVDDPNYHNFATIMNLLEMAVGPEGKPSALDELFAEFKQEHPNHLAVKSYATFLTTSGTATARSIAVSAQARLTAFNIPGIQYLTNTDTLDLESIGDKKVALFCLTSTTSSTFNYLIGLLYTQLFETLYHHAEANCKGRRLKYHVRFLLDEFANTGRIPEFTQKLATMRKYEISCTIVLQALSQLKALYKDDWDSIVGNCDSMIFLGSPDHTTLEYISKSLGQETIRSINTSRTYGRQGSYTTNYNKMGRDLMTTAELSIMENENCIYFLRGLHPFFAKKFQWKHHPNFPRIGADHPENIYKVTDKKVTDPDAVYDYGLHLSNSEENND